MTENTTVDLFDAAWAAHGYHPNHGRIRSAIEPDLPTPPASEDT